jgi:hypothetical protein
VRAGSTPGRYASPVGSRSHPARAVASRRHRSTLVYTENIHKWPDQGSAVPSYCVACERPMRAVSEAAGDPPSECGMPVLMRPLPPTGPSMNARTGSGSHPNGRSQPWPSMDVSATAHRWHRGHGVGSLSSHRHAEGRVVSTAVPVPARWNRITPLRPPRSVDNSANGREYSAKP